MANGCTEVQIGSERMWRNRSMVWSGGWAACAGASREYWVGGRRLFLANGGFVDRGCRGHLRI